MPVQGVFPGPIQFYQVLEGGHPRQEEVIFDKGCQRIQVVDQSLVQYPVFRFVARVRPGGIICTGLAINQLQLLDEDFFGFGGISFKFPDAEQVLHIFVNVEALDLADPGPVGQQCLVGLIENGVSFFVFAGE